MILWFGKKKKNEEMQAAGAEMASPELSAEEIAAKEAVEAEAAKAAAEKEEIERIVAEANKAWEERQAREAEEAAAEAKRLEEEARRPREMVLPVVGGLLWLVDYRIPFLAGAGLSVVSLMLVQCITGQLESASGSD